MNKFSKILIIVNIFLLIVVVGFSIMFFTSKNKSETDFFEPESIIVGEELEKAKSENMAVQGLKYEAPRGIYNSTNYYMPISVMTYEEAKKLNEIVESSGDISYSFYGYDNFLNILFLDKNYNVIGTLLKKKASISNVKMVYTREDQPVDKTANNILYMIAFEDTNKDGLLDAKDRHDLYISDLNGKNLKQVTKGIDVNDYDFSNSNSEIFIQYTDRENIREEHKRLKFGVYKIKTSTWVELNQINETLDFIELLLIK